MKALTPEEKAAKMARMKELIAARRAARGEEEKVDHVKVSNADMLLLLLLLLLLMLMLLSLIFLL